MVTIARGIVSIICYVKAIISGKICTKFPSVSIVSADMELIGGNVANVTELMCQSLLSDSLATVYVLTSIYQHNTAQMFSLTQITAKSELCKYLNIN